MCIYNGPFNTMGIGDPVPYGSASNMGFGSGDRFDFGPGWGRKKNFGSRATPAYRQYRPAMAMKMPPPMMPLGHWGAPRPLLVMAGGIPGLTTTTRKRKTSSKKRTTKRRTTKKRR